IADAEEVSGIRPWKIPQPNKADVAIRYNPDNPIIRLAEIYYMLAECTMRAGDKKTAAMLINKVRARNFENRIDPDPVTESNLDEYRMLDEWMIEFLAEGQGRRRTDLIRWDKFVTENWWDHTATKDKNRNIFPIPEKAISANNLLEQNPGY
ncbi:MAG TPA: RagB/SusD family nutrient uptake outer membrane protein, partial [Porphyromonadaceae bacterium]|nr:RagB/SusD family nutrient uptake outer membrane protein [Porphyromonadaceae bacterium]